MVVGEVATATDVLVIGGGPGGYAAAIKAAELGREVTLVERDSVGGVCLNVGCIPSKVMIHAAELAHLPTTTAGSGVRVETSVDLAELHRHMGSVVTGLTDGVSGLLARAGVTVVTGTARFSRANRAAVAGDDGVTHIEFRHAILATGSRPIELPPLPVDGHRVLDSTGALFAIAEVPDSLVVVGGGYIGVELGTAWAKLGAAVTMVEAAESLLPGLDARLGRVVTRRLGDLGVDVRLGTVARGLTDGHLRVGRGDGHDDDELVAAERVVVCVGRRPNTDDLGLEVTDVQLDDHGLVKVDPARRAGRNILAIGDITPGPALAHKATAEARVAAMTAAGLAAAFDPTVIPAVVFSDPEVASVGYTTAQAELDGIAATRVVVPFTASGRARTVGETIGHVELVADDHGTLIGAHIAGAHASELIAEAALAIEMAATVEEVAATIHAHPTLAETIQETAQELGDRLRASGAPGQTPQTPQR